MDLEKLKNNQKKWVFFLAGTEIKNKNVFEIGMVTYSYSLLCEMYLKSD